LKRSSIPVAVLLVLVVLLSAGSGLYAGASFFAQQAPVTVTTTIFTTTTSWTTSTIWSTVTAVVLGVWTTVQYTTSTSTVTVTGSTTPRAAKAITAYGNARISTAQSKFGGASGLFDGSGDYLSTPDSADWYFGTGDFTIDFWVRFNSVATSLGIYSQWLANNFVEAIWHQPTGTFYFDSVSAGVQLFISGFSWTLLVNTWYHIAVVRSGTNILLFLNGVLQSTTAIGTTSLPDINAALHLGVWDNAGAIYFNGWLDEPRVSKGVARWTSNFTPPTGAYASDSNTVLLLHMDGADGSAQFPDAVT